jgi:hypothetical protein
MFGRDEILQFLGWSIEIFSKLRWNPKLASIILTLKIFVRLNERGRLPEAWLPGCRPCPLLLQESWVRICCKIRLCLVHPLWQRKSIVDTHHCLYQFILVFSWANDVSCTRLSSCAFLCSLPCMYKKMPRVCKYIQSFTQVCSVKTSIESGYVYQ